MQINKNIFLNKSDIRDAKLRNICNDMNMRHIYSNQSNYIK